MHAFVGELELELLLLRFKAYSRRNAVSYCVRVRAEPRDARSRSWQRFPSSEERSLLATACCSVCSSLQVPSVIAGVRRSNLQHRRARGCRVGCLQRSGGQPATARVT